MDQWEFFYIQAPTSMMSTVMKEANKLGALGWEPVGITNADRTVGTNTNVLILKRRIAYPPPPPADTTEHWHPDPTQRFDKRRWEPALQVWSADVATMEPQKLDVDSPWWVRPTGP